METALTEDALMGGRVRLLQPRRGYRVAVDCRLLLAAAVQPASGERGARSRRRRRRGRPLPRQGACRIARSSASSCSRRWPSSPGATPRTNGLDDRVSTIVHDLARRCPISAGSTRSVTNPPYLAAKGADPSPDPSKALATVESSAGLARWLDVATGVLEPAGTLTLIIAAIGWRRSPPTWCGWAGASSPFKRLPPAARVLVRRPRHRNAFRHRVAAARSCTVRKAATPRPPKPSCAMPRR